jgi:hypothetical protein
VNVRIYVEGGGKGKSLKSSCREGFSKLIAKAGFQERMPKIVACGSRNDAYEDFKTAQQNETGYAILLVDSEEPFQSSNAWAHQKTHDNWSRPQDASDDQAQLMVTCMETWMIVDRQALQAFFGQKFNQNKLPSTHNIEELSRHEVQNALTNATRLCSRKYHKGELSYKLLAQLDPETLKTHLPFFRRFMETLASKLRRFDSQK